MAVVLKVEIKSIGSKPVQKDLEKIRTGTLKASKSAEEFGKVMKKLEGQAKGLKVGIAGTSKAFQSYKTKVNSGKISTDEFIKATMRMDRIIVKASGDLKTASTVQAKYSSEVKKSSKNTNGFANSADNMARSVRLMEGPLGGTAARLQTFAAVVKSGRLGMVAMALGATALIAVLVKFTTAAFRSEVAMQRLEARFRVAEGSTKGAKAALEDIFQFTSALGVNFKGAAQGFSLFAAAAANSALTVDQVREIFEGVTTAVAALSLSADDTRGIFRALSQMISKGTVQAEELKGQLGERLPGAFAIAARSMGVTTGALQKMLEQGEVVADEFLPRFADALRDTFAGDAAKAAQSLPNVMEKLTNQLEALLIVMSRKSGLSETFKDWLNTLEEAATALTDIAKFGPKIEGALTPLRELQRAGVTDLFPDEGDVSKFDFLPGGKPPPKRLKEITPGVKPDPLIFFRERDVANKLAEVTEATKNLRSIVRATRTPLEQLNKKLRQLKIIQETLPESAKTAADAQRRLIAEFEKPFIEGQARELKKQEDAFLKHLRFIEGLELKSIKIAEAADRKREADFIKHLRFIEQLEQKSITVRLKEAAKLEKERLKEANRVNEQLRGAFESVGNDFAAALSKGELALTSFKDFTIVIIQEIIKEFAKLAVIQPILNSLFGQKGIGGGLLSGFIGGIASFFGFDKGAALSKGNVIPFARGGIVSKPTIFPMAKGAGLMGESGPEAIMPLQRGKDGKLGVAAGGGGGGVVINMDFRGVHGTKEVERAVADGIRKAAPQLVTASVTKMRDENRRGVRA